MKSWMDLTRAKYALRNLSDLCIDNLRCGRITNEAVMRASQRVAAGYNNPDDGICVGESGNIPSGSELRLADELNDMLEGAMVVWEHKEKQE